MVKHIPVAWSRSLHIHDPEVPHLAPEPRPGRVFILAASAHAAVDLSVDVEREAVRVATVATRREREVG